LPGRDPGPDRRLPWRPVHGATPRCRLHRHGAGDGRAFHRRTAIKSWYLYTKQINRQVKSYLPTLTVLMHSDKAAVRRPTPVDDENRRNPTMKFKQLSMTIAALCIAGG